MSWALSQLSWSDLIASIRGGVEPPLYYVVLKLWAGLGGTSAAWLRLCSVTCLAFAAGGVRALAAQLWPGDEAVGKRLRIGRNPDAPLREVAWHAALSAPPAIVLTSSRSAASVRWRLAGNPTWRFIPKSQISGEALDAALG